ncbi:MAG TPA: hypothetical protein VG897_06100 [Terriglobales bacterium]|nr:hypothetical protein [Terriglobales bacterium]
MAFADLFPTAAWVGRKLKAPLTRKVVIFGAAILLLIGIILHIEAALFAVRVKSVLAGLRQVEVGQTSQKQLLKLVPGLKPANVNSHYDGSGRALEMKWDGIVPKSRVGQTIFSATYDNKYLFKIAYWLGYRPRNFYIRAVIQHDIVTHFGYGIQVLPSENHYPGVIDVGVSSPISILRYSDSPDSDEQNPSFSTGRYVKWRDWDIEASFSPFASAQLKDAAFGLHLECTWSLLGCSDAAQLLPDVEKERSRIRYAARARIRSAEPCPPSIIPAKVRDADAIWLLNVKRANITVISYTGVPQQPGVSADYELIRTLQKREDGWNEIRLKDDFHPLRLGDGEGEGVANPVIHQLTPGSKIVYFSGRYADLGPCKIMPATDDVMKRVDEAIALEDWSQAPRF